jgi:hypothetical protein
MARRLQFFAALVALCALPVTAQSSSWEYRLIDPSTNATSTLWGRIEARANASEPWGIVCAEWDPSEAVIACAQIFPNVTDGFVPSARFATQDEMPPAGFPTSLPNVNCVGSETALDQCSINQQWSCTRAVMLLCQPPPPLCASSDAVEIANQTVGTILTDVLDVPFSPSTDCLWEITCPANSTAVRFVMPGEPSYNDLAQASTYGSTANPYSYFSTYSANRVTFNDPSQDTNRGYYKVSRTYGSTYDFEGSMSVGFVCEGPANCDIGAQPAGGALDVEFFAQAFINFTAAVPESFRALGEMGEIGLFTDDTCTIQVTALTTPVQFDESSNQYFAAISISDTAGVHTACLLPPGCPTWVPLTEVRVRQPVVECPVPTAVVAVFDASGSVAEVDYDAMRQVAQLHGYKYATPGSEYTLIGFADTAWIIQDTTSDSALYISTIGNHQRNSGGTNFNAAFEKTAEVFNRTSSNYTSRTLLFFTDGQAPLQPAATIAAELRRQGVTIVVMTFGSGASTDVQTFASTPSSRFYAHFSNIAHASDHLTRLSRAACSRTTRDVCVPDGTIVGFEPRTGSRLGGAVVRLYGVCPPPENFTVADVQCVIGGVAAAGYVNANGSAHCVAPAMAVGQYGIQLTVNFAHESTAEVQSITYTSRYEYSSVTEGEAAPVVVASYNTEGLILSWDVSAVAAPKVCIVAAAIDASTGLPQGFNEITCGLDNNGTTVVPAADVFPNGLLAAYVGIALDTSDNADLVESAAFRFALVMLHALGGDTCQALLAQDPCVDFNWDQLPACPANLAAASISPVEWEADPACNQENTWFGSSACASHPGAVHCIRAAHAATGAGQQCCYTAGTLPSQQLLISTGLGAGTPDCYSPAAWYDLPALVNHYLWDYRTFDECCAGTSGAPDLSITPDCQRYLNARPSYQPPVVPPRIGFGNGFGDPQCVTLDGIPFLCNFLGEAIALQGPNGAQVQLRAQKHAGVDGVTIITAVAARDAGSATIQVESDGIALFFLVDAAEADVTGRKRFEATGVVIQLEDQQRSATIRFAASGLVVNVAVNGDILRYSVVTPESMFNQTSGLVGLWNGNSTDDFLTRDNTTVDSDSWNNTLYNDFITSWMTTASESIFTYPTGLTHATFSGYFYPSFYPNYLSEEERAVCEGNWACEFDVSKLGVGAAASSLAATAEADAFVVANNNPPVIKLVLVLLREGVVVTLHDPEGDALTEVSLVGFTTITAPEANTEITLRFNTAINDTAPIMQVRAVDSKGAVSVSTFNAVVNPPVVDPSNVDPPISAGTTPSSAASVALAAAGLLSWICIAL